MRLWRCPYLRALCWCSSMLLGLLVGQELGEQQGSLHQADALHCFLGSSQVVGARSTPHRQEVPAGTSPATEGHTLDWRCTGICHSSPVPASSSARAVFLRRCGIG